MRHPKYTLEQLKETPWAKGVERDSPCNYEEALALAMNPALRVEIIHTNETGEWQWAIGAGELLWDFWLDAQPTKRKAVALCREMGWRIAAKVKRLS